MLALNGQKWFKIILNLKTFKEYIRNIETDEATEIIIDTLRFLELANFHLLFYDGHEEQIEEYEIVSKNIDETSCMADNICVVIKESRIDKNSIYYFLYFNDTEDLIRDHIRRYNDYRRLCLEQYGLYAREHLPSLTNDLKSLADIEIKQVTKHILERLLASKKMNSL